MKTWLLVITPAILALMGGLMVMSSRGQGRGATGGDQIVDGIGETSLVARYPLDGNADDRSRDSHNATLRGTGGAYVTDPQFGKVLSLPGTGYLELPAGTLADVDTLSVVGWVYLNEGAAEQRFFDFSKSASAGISCTLTGGDAKTGFRTRITATGAAGEQGPAAAAIASGKWVHVAAVLDGAGKSITTYVDGAKSGESKGLTVALEQALDMKNPDANKLFIGRSSAGGGAFNGKLHDVRLYSVALTEAQVATIRRNALAGGQAVASGATAGPGAGGTSAASTASGPKLIAVADVTATTTVGQMPKLPVVLAGKYENGAKGPEVRVIWPSPRNSDEVQKAGTITVTGKIPGTDVMAKATVTVMESAAAVAPKRVLEPFALGEVVLNKDLSGRDTPFMRNRDKFVNTLAQTNPDNFLYMFRDAFGEKQPEGARALGGWDNQTTRLRGHASGHYMSALAQAYASSTYDEKLRANFLAKMNYMIDTLYELSQKSGKPKEPGGEANAIPTKVPGRPGGIPFDPAQGRGRGAGRAAGGAGGAETQPVAQGRMEFDSNLTAGNIRTDYWNWGTGFISAYPPDQFIMLELGASYGTSNAQIWAPYYTLHKILAGLLDCYEVGGNKKALEIATGMGHWVCERLKVVPPDTRNKMWSTYIAGEYGGMNEVMARMYRLTGDKQFLEGAKLFDNVGFFYGGPERNGGLAANVDTLRGRHANQHIPQITGALETYRDTQEPIYYHIADNFWDFATNDYLYSIGGVAGAVTPNNAECFPAEPDSLWQNGFNQGGQNETCATYNMLKLSRQLFMFGQNPKYMNYYEQAIYNDILASVAQDNAGNTYHIPLNPGSRKSFGNANMSGFSCCNGTALESNTKLQDSIYFRSADNSALYVNLYVPSTLTWTEKKASVKQETNFPYADSTKLTLTGMSGTEVMVRVPDWATHGFTVKIDGTEKQVNAKPGTYLSLGRDWKAGATIELKMPFGFHLFRVVDAPNYASVMYGPIVLASQEDQALNAYRALSLNMADMSKSIKGDPATLQFTVGDVTFKPFYESYDRYSVYFEIKPE